MEEKNFDLDAYLKGGVEDIVKGALKATASNPKESSYMLYFARLSRAASRKREKSAKDGVHIPIFLIASITSDCNLNCAGCYFRQYSARGGKTQDLTLTDEDWNRIFSEASELGISFILLAGGEPLLRRDVIETAGRYPEILFPVFTNGTLLDADYVSLFDAKRNLLPVLSIEGKKETTDNRRGGGVYDKARSVMETLREHQLIFGVSVTVTTSNLREVTGVEFLDNLEDSGCKAVIYVEYVPVQEGSLDLAPGEGERSYFAQRLAEIRNEYPDMVFIAFPGDEKSSGGCLAAGRGFFHINANGGAEPCPFSPYSDTNVKNTSLSDALRSPLFKSLREQNLLQEDHSGGCVLFEKRDRVEALLKSAAKTDPPVSEVLALNA